MKGFKIRSSRNLAKIQARSEPHCPGPAVPRPMIALDSFYTPWVLGTFHTVLLVSERSSPSRYGNMMD